MTTSNNDKFRNLHQALIRAPEYFGIAQKDRRACTTFAELAAKLGSETPPDPAELDAAYGPALSEARKLVAEGLLTADLPDNGGVALSQEPAHKATSASAEAASPRNGPSPEDLFTKYPVHPAAKIFPMMEPDALGELARDIKENGLQQAIVIHDGMVIDGRNRLEACKQGGIEPTYIEWTGKGSVVTWVLSVNLHRRHLTDQQRAMIAARVAEQFSAEAKERSAQNLRKNKDVVDESNQSTPGMGRSTERAAAVMNVTPSAAKKAAKVLKSGDEQLTKAVDTGKVSIDAAAQVTSLPKNKQRELVSKGKVQEAAKKIRDSKAASKSKADNSGGAQTSKPAVPAVTPESPPAQPDPSQEDKQPKGMDSIEPGGPEPKPVVAPKEHPLLRKLHESLDSMVTAALLAGKVERLELALQNFIDYANKFTISFEKTTSE